jgi:hypothetical protein
MGWDEMGLKAHYWVAMTQWDGMKWVEGPLLGGCYGVMFHQILGCGFVGQLDESLDSSTLG